MPLSAPFQKLWEVIRNGIGGAFPWWSERLALAEATRIRLLGTAQTDIEVGRVRALAAVQHELEVVEPAPIDHELIVERVRFRLEEQERKRQRNLEAISSEAALLLPGEVSEDPLDNDWVARFFGHAQDVSEPQMQRLWAAILAGEVAQPKQFSVRTLEVLRNLSTDEAKLFEKLSPYLVKMQVSWVAPFLDYDKLGIDLRLMRRLKDAGLVSDEMTWHPKTTTTSVGIGGRPVADLSEDESFDDEEDRVDYTKQVVAWNYDSVRIAFFPQTPWSRVAATILSAAARELLVVMRRPSLVTLLSAIDGCCRECTIKIKDGDELVLLADYMDRLNPSPPDASQDDASKSEST